MTRPPRPRANRCLKEVEGERSALLRGRLGPTPTNEGGPGHEEPYWLRQKLAASIRHLRDIEDYYRLRGGTPESFNMVRADRARSLYEQISEDFLNGRMDMPTMRERAERAEAQLADALAQQAADVAGWRESEAQLGAALDALNCSHNNIPPDDPDNPWTYRELDGKIWNYCPECGLAELWEGGQFFGVKLARLNVPETS